MMDEPRSAQVPISAVQEFWDSRPCNIRHSTQPLGTRQYFDEVEARKYFVESHIPKFAEFARWRGKKVLEVGCGIGTDTINFARHGAKVTAVDLSPASLELARWRAEVYGVQDRITFYQANAEVLDQSVPVERFDLIYSFGVLHHTPQPEHAIRQLRRYAGVDTTVKVMLYHRYSWKVLSILVLDGKGRFWQLQNLIARSSEAQSGCPVTYTYTQREASTLLERNGFSVKEAWVDHVFPYRVADYVQYRYRKHWYFRIMPPPIFHAFEQRFGWHLCISAVVGT